MNSQNVTHLYLVYEIDVMQQGIMGRKQHMEEIEEKVYVNLM